MNLIGNAGKFTYTPETGFAGSDSFTFQVTDALGTLSNIATVNVTVNDVAPKARSGSAFSMGGRAVRGNLSATTAYIGQTLSFSVVTPPVHGAVRITKTGAYTYTPARGYKGKDSFTFQVMDQWGTASTAVVTITVR